MDFPPLRFGKKFSRALCSLLSAVVFAVPVALVFFPSSSYSEQENRMLATFPIFSGESLLEGNYTESVAAYLSDHLPLRSTLLKAKSLAEYAAMKGENNNVIAARDGYLVKRFEYTDEQLDTLNTNLEILSSLTYVLQERGHPVTVLCAPRAIDVLADLCPKSLCEIRSPWKILGEAHISHLTVTELLGEKVAEGQPVWFRTDHHWTALGAYYAYTALGDSLGFDPYPLSDFSSSTVSNGFLGTTYSSCLLPMTRPDAITILRYEGDDRFICVDPLTKTSSEGFYCSEKLATKDQYEYFLGGNTAHLRISKSGEVPRKTLLVIKDSYAQSLVPFLARHFDIELIDLRYFRTDAADAILQALRSSHYAGTLILFNIDTLTGNAGLENLAVEKLKQ